MKPEPRISRRYLLAGLAVAPGLASVLGACSDADDGPVARPADDTAGDTTVDAAGGTEGGTSGGSVSTAADGDGSSTTAGGDSSAYVPPVDGEWATTDASSAGFTDEGLAAIAQLVEETNGRTFTMVHGGRILAEHYWGASADTPGDVASVQKSFTSTLLGIARSKGLLSFDDPVSDHLGSGWTNASPAQEGAIRIVHLMTMTSGLNERTLRVDAPPGARFEYNTQAYQKLRFVLEAAAGTDINSLTTEWLFAPIGIDNPEAWTPRPGDALDAVGEPAWGLELRAREMARFGLLALRGGDWGGTAVTDAGWFDEAWTPIPQKRDYGYLWWLVGRGPVRRAGAPADAVAALGALDQKIYVIPSFDLVVTRQGLAANEAAQAQSDFDRLLVRALVNARA